MSVEDFISDGDHYEDALRDIHLPSSLYAGVPDPVDLFTAVDAINQLVDRLKVAGYSAQHAPVKVAVLVRQILRAWGVAVEVPESALLESNPPGTIQSWEALELRRAWAAQNG